MINDNSCQTTHLNKFNPIVVCVNWKSKSSKQFVTYQTLRIFHQILSFMTRLLLPNHTYNWIEPNFELNKLSKLQFLNNFDRLKSVFLIEFFGWILLSFE